MRKTNIHISLKDELEENMQKSLEKQKLQQLMNSRQSTTGMKTESQDLSAANMESHEVLYKKLNDEFIEQSLKEMMDVSGDAQNRSKKELLSLKGDSLMRHVQKEIRRSHRRSIANDLSLYAVNDYQNFQDQLNIMESQNKKLRLNDKSLENKLNIHNQSSFNKLASMLSQSSLSPSASQHLLSKS